MPVPIGTVVKVLHNGQKAYAVVHSDLGKKVRVVYPFAADLVDEEVEKKDCRKVHEKQDFPLYNFLRQLVGIKYQDSPSAPVKPIKATGSVSAQKTTPAPLPPVNGLLDAMIEGEDKPFTISHPDLNNGKETPIDQVNDPTGMLKAIQKNLGALGASGIKWVNPNDTEPQQ